MFWGWESKILKVSWQDREVQSSQRPEGSHPARSWGSRSCSVPGPEVDSLCVPEQMQPHCGFRGLLLTHNPTIKSLKNTAHGVSERWEQVLSSLGGIYAFWSDRLRKTPCKWACPLVPGTRTYTAPCATDKRAAHAADTLHSGGPTEHLAAGLCISPGSLHPRVSEASRSPATWHIPRARTSDSRGLWAPCERSARSLSYVFFQVWFPLQAVHLWFPFLCRSSKTRWLYRWCTVAGLLVFLPGNCGPSQSRVNDELYQELFDIDPLRSWNAGHIL